MGEWGKPAGDGLFDSGSYSEPIPSSIVMERRIAQDMENVKLAMKNEEGNSISALWDCVCGELVFSIKWVDLKLEADILDRGLIPLLGLSRDF